MTNEQHIRLLNELAGRFHNILSALTARRFLDTERKLTEPIRVEFEKRAAIDVEELAADGFEACVMALRELGAPNVSIFNCSPSEEP